MVADHLATVHAETGSMVSAERTRDLSNMYTLLRPVPNGLTVLVHHVKDHIKQQGLQAVTSLKGDNVRHFAGCGFVEKMYCVRDVSVVLVYIEILISESSMSRHMC